MREQQEIDFGKTIAHTISLCVYCVIFIGFVNWVSPKTIPFDFLQFWQMKGSLLDAIKSSWIILLWGTGVTILYSLFTRNSPDVNRNAESVIVGGTLVSAWAGIAEEICFRWLVFYTAIVTVQIANWCFFGFLGFGITKWLFLKLIGPFADLLTLGYLHHILFNGFGWAVGSAIIVSNGKFRDGHSYQGVFGWINAWFLGMFFFYIMFTFGLPAAIVVHFLYDLFIFGVRYVDAAAERALGWT